MVSAHIGVHGLRSAEDSINGEGGAELVHAEAALDGGILLGFDLGLLHNEM